MVGAQINASSLAMGRMPAAPRPLSLYKNPPLWIASVLVGVCVSLASDVVRCAPDQDFGVVTFGAETALVRVLRYFGLMDGSGRCAEEPGSLAPLLHPQVLLLAIIYGLLLVVVISTAARILHSSRSMARAHVMRRRDG